MSFNLPQLDYNYNSLEPYIDAKTMEIHHSKHHQGYTNNLNAAIKDTDNESRDIILCFWVQVHIRPRRYSFLWLSG